MENHLSVLIIDDDSSIRQSVKGALELTGYKVHVADSAKNGLTLLNSQDFDLVLCDFKMPEVDGLAFIERCKDINSSAVIVLMSAHGNDELAIEAIKHGASEYLAKPFTNEELLFALRKTAEREHLHGESAAQREASARKYNFSNIIAQSARMQEIFETVKRLANFKTTILISGESGTGKELIARAIHYNSSRCSQPFVPINCGAIPENLIESELFGHKKGSFTDATRDKRGLFEEANGGTIFLDEIGELPLHLQVKLLRVLQEQRIRRVGDEHSMPIDVRILAATHRDLEDDVMTGRFRDDLFYRLNVVSIHIPPLRERPDDIAVLIKHFIKKHNKRLGLAIKGVDAEAHQALLNYSWRGNVRELENCIERAMVLTETEQIGMDVLSEHIKNGSSSPAPTPAEEISDDNLSVKQRVKNLEIALIKKALLKTHGNRTHAAKLLEISHRTLLYKLKEYGLGD